jgi:hypothetical protein
VVRALLKARPDMTLEELRDALAQEGIRIGRSSVDRFVKARGLTLKKSRSTLPNRTGRMSRPRAAWRDRQPGMNSAQFVFIDETWATTNMTRQRGRCPRCERLVAAVPHGHWKTSTFVAALRTTGLTAPLVLDGAINGEAFRAYVEQILAPTLAPGDIVIMDNLGSHKVAGIREAIEACGVSCSTCRPTAPISTRSSYPSPSSRRSSARPPRAPAMPSGTQSADSSTASRRESAPTTSLKPAMLPDRETL